MLTADAKRLYETLKSGGLEALKTMDRRDRDMLVSGNFALFVVEKQVADPQSGIVETRKVIDWASITDELIYDALREHGRI